MLRWFRRPSIGEQGFRVLQTQIVRLESCNPNERRPVPYTDGSRAPLKNIASAKFLDRAIGVNGGDGAGGGQIRLGEWAGKAIISPFSDGAQAYHDLADEVRHPSQRTSAPEIHDPVSRAGILDDVKQR